MKRKQSAQQSYVISVSLGTGCYRHIRIYANDTLEMLSDAILAAFSFDNDHQHAFFMDNRLWSREWAFFLEKDEPGDQTTSSVHLCQLGLPIGAKFKYLFDFGDEWTFQCRVLKLIDEPTKEATVIRSVGEAPEQYEKNDDCDEDDCDEDGGDEEKDDDNALLSLMSAQSNERLLTISDGLYEKAFLFRQSKLWLRLLDSELFAVKHSDQTIGYCCVMGILGEHLSLAVYPGDAGLVSYRRLMDVHDRSNEFAIHERMMSQDCVMLSLENKSDLFPGEFEANTAHAASHKAALKGKYAYPHFQRYQPCHYPWYITDTVDQQHLLEALEAALDVSDKLLLTMPESIGFTEGEPYHRSIPLLEKTDGGFTWSALELPELKPIQYPAVELLDEITLARLAKAKHSGEWACDVVLHVEAVESESDGQAPYFPYMLLLVNNSSGMVLSAEIAHDASCYADKFGKNLIDLMLRLGKPKSILVCNARAYALLEPLTKQIDVKLSLEQRIPLLEEAEESLLQRIDGADGNSPDEEISQVMEALAHPEVYPKMPTEMLLQLQQVAQTGALSKEIVANLKRELKKRGL